jgi:heme/copper-type cytochrome/quinol oxidase subunit 2
MMTMRIMMMFTTTVMLIVMVILVVIVMAVVMYGYELGRHYGHDDAYEHGRCDGCQYGHHM